MSYYSMFGPWFQVPHFKNGADKVKPIEEMMALETMLKIHSLTSFLSFSTSLPPFLPTFLFLFLACFFFPSLFLFFLASFLRSFPHCLLSTMYHAIWKDLSTQMQKACSQPPMTLTIYSGRWSRVQIRHKPHVRHCSRDLLQEPQEWWWDTGGMRKDWSNHVDLHTERRCFQEHLQIYYRIPVWKGIIMLIMCSFRRPPWRSWGGKQGGKFWLNTWNIYN